MVREAGGGLTAEENLGRWGREVAGHDGGAGGRGDSLRRGTIEGVERDAAQTWLEVWHMRGGTKRAGNAGKGGPGRPSEGT